MKKGLRLFERRFLLNAMSLRERTRAFVRALILLSLLLAPGLVRADEPTITITVGDNKRSFTRGELLARADATTIEVARDITYRLPMSYRAVQVAALLAGMTLPPDSVIEAVALDGFVAQLPPDLMLNTDNSNLQSNLRIIPGRQSREATRARDRFTLFGPGPTSAASEASNGRIMLQCW